MRTKLLPTLLAFVLLTPVCAPTPARAQERGLGVAPAQAGAGDYHALVIGNNAYTKLPRLKTAEADAREIAALLKGAYGFETTLLTNATRQQIVSALSAYRRRLGPDSSLLVYYAGHGFNDRDADKTYWLPVDAERDDTSNWIIADEITAGVRVVPARHVLVVSDSCYSGTLTRGIGEALPPSPEREQFIKRMAAGRSRTLMASGGDEPVADGGGGGTHSVFAAALLRGLREMGSGQFTAAELFRHYVEEPVAGRAQQTPEYNPLRNSGHESGDFVFVRTRAGGRDAGVTAGAPLTAKVDPMAVELAFWDAVKNSTDPEDFKSYLDKYPDGQFAALARRRIAPSPAIVPYGDPKSPKPDFGVVRNSVYTNNYFNLRIPVPAGWDVYDEESRERTMQRGKEEMLAAIPDKAQEINNSLQQSLNLLTLDNRSVAANDGETAMLVAGAELVPPGQAVTASQYMEALKHLLLRASGYEVVVDVHPETVGGVGCSVMIVKRVMPGVTVKQKYLSFIRKGYAVFLIASYRKESGGRTLDDILRKSTLN